MNINTLIVVVLLTIYGFVVIHKLTRYLDHRIENDIRSLQLESERFYYTVSYDRIEEIIDKIVNDAGTLYIINHHGYVSDDDKIINAEEIQNMAEFMFPEIMFHITPAIESMLRLSVNIDSEDDMMKYIKNKIQLYILKYSIDIMGNET